jgi:hypothetical protein
VVKEVLRGSLAQITTEQKHGVLQHLITVLAAAPYHGIVVAGCRNERGRKP